MAVSCMRGSRLLRRCGARMDSRLEGLTFLLLLQVRSCRFAASYGWLLGKVSVLRLNDLHSVSGPAGQNVFCHVRSRHVVCVVLYSVLSCHVRPRHVMSC